MSLSDCEKCWSTPCECGYAYKGWKSDRVLELIETLKQILVERQHKEQIQKEQEEGE